MFMEKKKKSQFLCEKACPHLSLYAPSQVMHLLLDTQWNRVISGTSGRTFSSVAQSCPTLCDPMNCGTPGLRVHHQFPKSTQTHVHWVGDAIQPSHPLSSLLLLPSIFPSIRVFSKCQFFASGGHSIGVSALASVLPMNIHLNWYTCLTNLWFL